MFNQVSYNVIVERFKAFAAGHLQIQRFSHGQITTNHLDLTPENTFPWMHVVPVSVQPINGAHAFTFDVLLCDLPRDKENKTEYQREAISDTIRLAEDLLAEVRNGGVIFGEDVVLREGATIVPFMEEYSYVLTGVTLTLTMEFPWDWSACDIPATWTSGGTGHGTTGGGGVGLVLRVNGTDNVVQSILDLVDGVGIEVTDLGDGRVRITNTGGGGGAVAWGAITGTLSNQTDLQLVLDTKVNTGDLAAVAFSGDYNDLINQPSQPGLQEVINTDPNLYSNNTIAGNNTTIEFNNMADFKVNGNDGAGTEVNIQLTGPTNATINALDTGGDYEARLDVDATTAQIKSNTPVGGGEVLVGVAAGRHVYVKTENIHNATANNGEVLTLVDKTTGKVEYNAPTITPSGPAGGDLTGTYPDPVVSHIHGTEMQSGTPTDGDTWVFHGTNNKWQHQQLHASQVDNDSGVTGTHVNLALDHLNTTKVEANAPITGATKTKITYDGKGLVTAGADLAASDLPTGIDAAKISTGVVSNTEFNYLDGVTSGIQNQINGKVTGNAAITPGTNTKITYDAKGLVTGGTNLVAGDLPTHTHTASQISNATTFGVDAMTWVGPGGEVWLKYKPGTGMIAKTDADLAAVVASSGYINVVRLPSNQTTTLATSTAITNMGSINVPAGSQWVVRLVAGIGCNNTGGVRFSFSWLNGGTTTLAGGYHGFLTNNSAQRYEQITIASGTLYPTTTTYFNAVNSPNGFVVFELYLINSSASADTLTIGYASGVAGQTSTIYSATTFLHMTRIA